MRRFLVCVIGALCSLAAIGQTADPELAAALQTGCLVPTTTVTVPDGATAAEREMIAAAGAIKRRDAEATAYARCVKEAAARMLEDAALPEARRSAVQTTQRELVDAAIVPVERIAADFNVQLRCFRSRDTAASSCASQAAQPPASAATTLASQARPPGVLNSAGLSYADSPEERSLIMRSCWSLDAKNRGVEGRMVINVTVDAQGKVTEARAEDEGSRWARQVAECLGRRLRFNPGTGPDGQAIASSARLSLAFALVDEDGKGGISKPRLISTANDIEAANRKCYPQELGAAGPTAQVTYRATLGTLGGIMTAKVEKSSGDERLDEAGRCVLKTLRFEPSRREGMPVEVSFPWIVLVRPPTG